MKHIAFTFIFMFTTACLAEERVPFAIAPEDVRDVIQQALEEADICFKENSQDIAPVINGIDQIVGHDDWGWSCSPDMANLLTARNIGSEWAWPSKEDIRNAWRLENQGFLSGLGSTQLDINWRETTTPGYESVLYLLAQHYKFTVTSGVALTGWSGRYFEFSPPLSSAHNTVNRVRYRCSVLGGAFCFEAFFMIDGMIYPTIMPRGDISRE